MRTSDSTSGTADTSNDPGSSTPSPLVDPLDNGDQFNTLDPVIVRTDFVPGSFAASDGKIHLT
jgi:hypothetical protein